MRPLLLASAVTLAIGWTAGAGAQGAPQTRPAAPRAGSSVAYVSVQKLLNESNAAKAAAKQIEELRRARTEDVSARKKALDQTKLAIANSGGFFSRSRLVELRKVEQRQEAELRQATEEAQKAIVDLQRTLQEELRQELSRVLDQMARERPFEFVLNADTALVWARNGNDLTDEVLRRLNAATDAKAADTKAGDAKAADAKAADAKKPAGDAAPR